MTIEALKEVPKFHFESHVVDQEKNEEDIDVVAGADDQASMQVCICTLHLNTYLTSSLFHSCVFTYNVCLIWGCPHRLGL